MKLNDSFALAAPRPQVWGYLLDVKKVARCIPGAESVEQMDDTHYKGTLVVQLGPVKPKFIGDVTITSREEPERMTGFFRAKDRGAGSNISAQFMFSLTETEPAITTAHYECDLAIRGRMAAFGSSVIAETAKQLTAAFAAALQEELNAAQSTASAFPAEAAPASATTLQPVPPRRPKASLLAIFFKSLWAVFKDKLLRLLHNARVGTKSARQDRDTS